MIRDPFQKMFVINIKFINSYICIAFITCASDGFSETELFYKPGLFYRIFELFVRSACINLTDLLVKELISRDKLHCKTELKQH